MSQYTIGVLTFKAKPKIEFSNQVNKLLKERQWLLDFGNYRKNNCSEIFKNTLQALIEKIDLGYNAQPKIITHIKQISFPHLTQLWLSHNNISNIQVLQQANMPNLKQLWLRDNYITSIKSIRRANFPKLTCIGLYQNFINDLSWLSQLDSNFIQAYWIQYQSDQYVQDQSLQWIVKVPTKVLQHLFIGTRFRSIQNRGLLNKIKAKFPKVSILNSAQLDS